MLRSDIRGWIGAALEGSGWSVDEIAAGIAKGDFFLFPHAEGCMVGEFITSPRHKVMHVFAMGGTLKAVTDLLPVVEAFARIHGCDTGGATGRPGWVRFLRRYGYEPASTAVQKEL